MDSPKNENLDLVDIMDYGQDIDVSALVEAVDSLDKSRNINCRGKIFNYITQLVFEMEESLTKLEAKDFTVEKLEEMSVFIYESMCISARNYHSVQHVFDILNHDNRLRNNPITVLATCFHDCIYYHVDGGLTPVQAKLLKGCFKIEGPKIEEENDSDYVTSQSIYKFFATPSENRGGNPENNTLLLQMVETIFGYTPGQNISISNDGLNEFLSALVAVRMLGDHLPLERLAEIACCIESTIPFRPIDKNTGKSHMDLLFENMKEARDVFGLLLSDEDLVSSVQEACLLSNSDVGNFGTTDRHWFLDNAWSLLPETNESLRNEYIYSVHHFHSALYKMYGFYGFLEPGVVFHHYRGVPDASEMERLTEECSNNLAFGRTYVGAKLVAMSLVSAIALLTGGDAPISLFTGDLREAERRSSMMSIYNVSEELNRTRLEKLRKTSSFKKSFVGRPKNQREEPKKEECNLLVYRILAEGRRSKSSFDTKRSPWAAELYSYMGDEGLKTLLKELNLYPMTEKKAW
eukprot:CAMPEP_0172371714 /NCGR_PEP_ID=MMETSP1060-20121228/44524_1 /TAXON_ID=37318 /ORGANISM="Pseudo-nitzschia pungens, Strain cf. cingulata" /LENGTH=519 /DNA_ID=CAMNT_0013097439 /DNA_START=194 /DNA_END=1750 /DNA_ORIENTATION=+